MKQQWIERPEGGNAVALRWFIRFALLVGRRVARALIMPITLYFLVRRGPERRASRNFLTRLNGTPPSLRQVWRHLLHFAVVGLDRVYLLAENLQRFDIRTHGVQHLLDALDQQRGILLFGSHIGSYEVLRAFSQLKPEVQVRAVLDVQQTPMMTTALAYLNPQIAAGIINARKDGTQTALEIKEALDQKAVVTLLVDRARPGNTVVTPDFLGEPAPFPTAPWQLAATLKVPVVLCFGLYRGGNRYDLHFELFANALTLQRGRREADLQQIVQRYADRLAHHIRAEPYNWFNFYDFWQKNQPVDPAVAADDEQQRLVRQPDVAALIARLAKPAPTTVDFTEVRFSALLREPLIVSGQLLYAGPQSLDRQVTAPYQEDTQIRGQTVRVQRAGQPARSFGLQRAPELRGLLAGLTALLAGDVQAIERDFSVAAQGDERGWQLELTPVDARIRKRLKLIRAQGSETEARCFELVNADNGLSIMLLGAAAKLPGDQPLTREALERRCGGGS